MQGHVSSWTLGTSHRITSCSFPSAFEWPMSWVKFWRSPPGVDDIGPLHKRRSSAKCTTPWDLRWNSRESHRLWSPWSFGNSSAFGSIAISSSTSAGAVHPCDFQIDFFTLDGFATRCSSSLGWFTFAYLFGGRRGTRSTQTIGLKMQTSWQSYATGRINNRIATCLVRLNSFKDICPKSFHLFRWRLK